MADAITLVETLKKAAVEAVEAKKPVNVCFGAVVSAAPLKINVGQKMKLGEKQLVLSRNVTDFKVTSASSGETTVYNGLVAGDEVILIRQQGGQKFIVLDRIGI